MKKVVDYKMYVDGKWVDASNGKKIQVESPTDGELIATVPMGTKEDAIAALVSSERAQKSWSKLPAVERASYLIKLAALLRENKEELARSLVLEQGKVINEARGEVESSAMFLEYAAGHARRLEGDILPSQNKDEQIWIQMVPHGVTVGIIPWNYPLSLSARKLGNALICGNTMIIKPPSETPVTVLKMAELVEKSGFPKGVLNIVTGKGSEMGDELVRNPISKLVTLTGSTSAGKKLYESAAEHIKILRLELGGKAPFIVLEDADIDKAVDAAVIARYANCGQICICNERMYIHKDIYDEFLSKFLIKVSELKMGDPLDDETFIGPKVNKDELEKIEQMLNDAIKEGGKVLCGGKRPSGGIYDKGYWFMPTVVEVSDNKMEIMQEEIFGPMVPVMKVSSFDEALTFANDSKYGLSAYVFTKNIRNIMRVANELEFGEVYLNRSCGEQINGFHNGHKESGLGGEDGKYGLDAYLAKKTMYVDYSDRT